MDYSITLNLTPCRENTSFIISLPSGLSLVIPLSESSEIYSALAADIMRVNSDGISADNSSISSGLGASRPKKA